MNGIKQARRPPAGAHVDKLHDEAMHLVGDVQHVAVGETAFDRVRLEQRGLGRAADDDQRAKRQEDGEDQCGSQAPARS